MSAFAFKMWAVARRDDPYYVTNWDGKVPITVVAETKQEAINKADTALGPAGDHRHWTFSVASITDVLIAKDADEVAS